MTVGTSSLNITTRDPKTSRSPMNNRETRMAKNTIHGLSSPEKTPIEATAFKCV